MDGDASPTGAAAGGGSRRFRGPGGIGRSLGGGYACSSTGGGVCFARVRLPAIGGSPRIPSPTAAHDSRPVLRVKRAG